jgi:hypothetical protein
MTLRKMPSGWSHEAANWHRDLGLATHEEKICRNCDRELRRLGRATRRARDLRAAALRDAVIYRPLHHEHFEISVVHVDKASLVTIDAED